ncbi:MAG: hypothetical protein ACJASM_002045 [Salibacteraceae bacterium]|jgi:hypothetical protein
MSNTNLDLWNKVQETDPKYAKKANVKGNKMTSIAPQYQIKMVTEQFGTYGVTWGFKDIVLDYTLTSIPFKKEVTEGTYPNVKVLGKEDSFMGIVVFKAIFFFPKGEFPIINSSSLFTNNEMTKIDDNFAKKVETDTLTKAISKLGFNADIFMGMFDDPAYVNEMKKKFGDSISLQNLKDMFEEKRILVPDADLHYYEGTIENELENNYDKLYHLLSKMKS